MVKNDQSRRTRNFASLRATFSRNTVVLEEPKVLPQRTEAPTTKPAPPATTPADRRQSKYTLFDLFSKPKVQTARGYHETSLGTVSETVSAPKAQHFSPRAQQKSDDKITVNPVSNTPAPRPQQAQPPPVKLPKSVEYWEPPPLFQAYPQAIRHGSLQTPAVSIEALQRTQNLRKQVGVFPSTPSLPFVREDDEGEQGQDSSKLVSKRFSTVNDTPGLVDKVFVLVTAGRLVQYDGDGNYDRMPEKVLQLGEKSAAFVCDLIPGKHWVVQVVQHMSAQSGNQINKSRSILSRLRMPASGRRAANSFLLVFDNAEDQEVWLKAIRGVIENMGGAKRESDPEDNIPREQSPEKPAEEQLSHRYRVSRPPSMISTSTSIRRPLSTASLISPPRSPHSPPPRSPRSPVEMTLPSHPETFLLARSTPSNSPRDAEFPLEVQSLAAAAATENSSLEHSVASTDQIRLDKIREGSRKSVVSVRTDRTSEENDTVPTSKASPGPPSPREFPLSDKSTVEKQPLSLQTSTVVVAKRLSVVPISPIDVTEVDASIPIRRGSGDVEPQKVDSAIGTPPMMHTPPIVLELPRQRASQLYSQTLPARLRLDEKPGRPNSQIMEPWAKNRPDSVVGHLPNIKTRRISRMDSTSRPQRPLSRMLPVRVSDPAVATLASSNSVVPHPRRLSSLPAQPTSHPMQHQRIPSADAASTINADSPATSSTGSTPPLGHRSRTPSSSRNSITQPSPTQVALRRPTSLQIRSDPAPFLSQRRTSASNRQTGPTPAYNSYFAGSSPMGGILPLHNPPSVTARPASTIAPMNTTVTTNRAHSIPADKAAAPSPAPMPIGIPPALHADKAAILAAPPLSPPGVPPPIPPMNPLRTTVRPRASMPVIPSMPAGISSLPAGMAPIPVMVKGLPPPAPPPSMPLPSLPSPPPNIPLPPPPPGAKPGAGIQSGAI